MNPVAAAFELRAAMQRLETEPTHTHHVAHLALRLFDELQPLHQFGAEERVLLEGGACLHDIGWAETRDGSGHHKISAQLIRQQPWQTLSRSEVEILAQVARYHRRALPSPDHEDYQELSRRQKRIVRTLAAILRLADAFDRSHLQLVRNLHAIVGERKIEIVLAAQVEPVREIAAAQKKGDLAREVFEREFEFSFERTLI